MTYYAPWLVTLNYVRTHRGLETSETADDTLLKQFIAEASAEFIEGLQRVPMPYAATQQYGASRVEGLCLKLRDDLLAVTTLTQPDSTAVDAGAYNLRPDNVYPKHTVELKSAGATYWDVRYPEDRISLNGLWGYVPHYLNGAWKQVTTLGEDLDASETGIDLTSATGIEVGHYLQVGSETLGYVTAVSSNTVTVDARGALGTTAASHDTSAAVSVYRQLADIQMAVREMVVYKYLHKDQIGTRVTVIADGVVTVEDLSPSVEATIKRHRRKLMPMAV